VSRRLLQVTAWVALIWGFCEATWFFVIPDPWLSWAATRSNRSAVIATVASIGGAMLGAAALYGFLGTGTPPEALHALWRALPGFYPKMAAIAHDHLTPAGARGLLAGPMSGIPYRIYVVEAWSLGIPLGAVLAWTPLARLERMIFAPVVVAGLRMGLERWVAPRLSVVGRSRMGTGFVVGVGLYWAAVYAWYWGWFLPRNYG